MQSFLRRSALEFGAVMRRKFPIPLMALTLAVFALLAFQPAPQPSPTPLINFVQQTPAPAVDEDRLWDLLDRLLPILLAGGLLIIAFGRKQVDKVGVQVDAAKVDVKRDDFVTDMAAKTTTVMEAALETAKSAAIAIDIQRKTTAENDQLRTDFNKLQSDFTSKEGENTALRGQIVILTDRVDDLDSRLRDRALDLKEKERIIAAKDLEIMRLNARMLEYASASIPPGAVMQPQAVPAFDGPPIPVVIENKIDDPVPTMNQTPEAKKEE